MEEENIKMADDNKKIVYPILDRNITDPQQRNKLVHHIVDTLPQEALTPYYLQQLAKYLTQTPDNKKSKKVLTNNRMVTINKRETSYQGLVAKMENGEDGIYNFSTDGDKNILLVPKIEITEDDIKNVPGLKQLRAEIARVQAQQKVATGRRKFLLTKQLIEMRQDQYILKSVFKPPISTVRLTKCVNYVNLDEHITINEKGDPVSDGLISLFNPQIVCCLLCNYSKIKEQAWGHFEQDWWYLMQDLDNLVDAALKEKYPILYKILIYKIDGLQNKEISQKIKEQFDVTYSVEYLSNMWRKKIPKIISDKAKEDWLIYHFTVEEKGTWKRCSRCHEIKLAHPYYFSKNKTAKDGWYSMCKCCRNKKKT